ncbi:MAG: helix-turn-helix transcriptional regulator [Clostridia bacterium]
MIGQINTLVAALVLAGIRAGRGITLNEMSRYINSSSSYVSNLENGDHHKIDLAVIGMYSRACDVPVEEILHLIANIAVNFNPNTMEYFMYRDPIENRVKHMYRRDRIIPRTRRSYNRS